MVLLKVVPWYPDLRRTQALGITNEGSKVEIDPASLDAAQTAKDKIISGEITVPSTIDEVK